MRLAVKNQRQAIIKYKNHQSSKQAHKTIR